MSNKYTLVLTPDERSQFEGLQSEFLRIVKSIKDMTSMTSNTIAELWNALHTFDALQRELVRMIQSTRENILELLDAHTMQVVGTADAIIQACNADDSPAPTIGALLDQFGTKYKEVFMRRVRTVPVRFFTPMPIEKGEAREDSVPRHTEAQNGHKLDVLLQILAKHNVGSNTIHILEETLEENQMRALPYYTVYLEDPMCTICISDQIGERTYVYPGVLVSAMQLASIQKQERIEGTSPIGVTLGTWYATRLEAAIFRINNTSTVFSDAEIDEPSKLTAKQQALLDNAVVDPAVMQEEGLERVVQMQMDILGVQKELEAVGVIFWNGRVCTAEMEESIKWPQIKGKSMQSYPNRAFLRRHNVITTDRHRMQSSIKCSTLLHIIGFSIVSEAETDEFLRQYDKAVRCPLYKAEIESIQKQLEAIGVIFWNEQVCTADMQQYTKWPKINGKNLMSYPNAIFLRRNGIITQDQYGMLSNSEFSNLLQVLGFPIVRKENEKIFLVEYGKQVLFSRYKEELEAHKSTLETAGIIFWNGQVCTEEMVGLHKWPTIKGKLLSNYPNIEFLRRHGIVAENDLQISRSQQITALLQILGFNVVSKKNTAEFLKQYDINERCAKYKMEIIRIQRDLEEAGIIFWNQQVCTAEMNGIANWPTINNKSLQSYPNAEFLRRHHIIEKKQDRTCNTQQFAKLLTVLGFSAVIEADTEEYLQTYDRAVRCPRYRAEIQIIKRELEGVGVIFRNEQVYTEGMSHANKWPQINGGSLRYYPNARFLRRYRIIKNDQKSMHNRYEFSSLLQVLGFTVVDSIPQE